MQGFLSTPWVITVGWILGAIGWGVGIISGVLQIRSTRYEHGHNAILEQAERDWEGKFTQEQIDSMKQELRRLEESISRDVPRKARRLFLEDQISTLGDDLARNYSHYMDLAAELGNQEEKLPDPIQHAIEKSIMPSYIANKRENRRLQWLLGLAILLIVIINWNFVASLIPVNWSLDSDYSSLRYPASWFVIYFILAVTVSVTMNQLFVGALIRKLAQRLISSLTLKDQGKSLRQKIKIQLKTGVNFLIFFGMAFTLIVSPFLYRFSSENSATSYGEPRPMPLGSLPQAVLCSIPPAIIFLIFYYIYKASRKITLNSKRDKGDEHNSTENNTSKI